MHAIGALKQCTKYGQCACLTPDAEAISSYTLCALSMSCVHLQETVYADMQVLGIMNVGMSKGL